MVFSRVTLFSFYSNQSDAVHSGGAFTSANMCFPEDVMVIAGYSELLATGRFRLVGVMVASASKLAADDRTVGAGHCIVKCTLIVAS